MLQIIKDIASEMTVTEIIGTTILFLFVFAGFPVASLIMIVNGIAIRKYHQIFMGLSLLVYIGILSNDLRKFA